MFFFQQGLPRVQGSDDLTKTFCSVTFLTQVCTRALYTAANISMPQEVLCTLFDAGSRGVFPGAGARLGPAGRAGAGRFGCVWAAGGGGGGRDGTGREGPPGDTGRCPAATDPKNCDCPVLAVRLAAFSGSTPGLSGAPGRLN